jgi:hypothetical protein
MAAVVLTFITTAYLKEPCNPPAPECGPLYGNMEGTKFCCANRDQSCCYAAFCSGNIQ